MKNVESLLGVGIYSIRDAARFTSVSPRTIKRWLTGHAYSIDGDRRVSPAVWTMDFERAEDDPAELSFRDLMEVRFISSFRNSGVSWPSIRKAAAVASELTEMSHPFSTKRFKTDGRTIFLEVAARTGDKKLLDLVKRQFNIHSVVSPHLFKGVQFDVHGAAAKWFPLYPNRRVVIDPAVAFGRPVTQEHVPTSAIAGLAKVEEPEVVARWFGVSRQSVAAAVEYQKQLAA